MKTESPDTHSEIERVQIELLRQATMAKRFHLVRSLSATTRRLAWEGIRRAHPDLPGEEIDLLFVAVHYGQDLVDRVRAYLAARRQAAEQPKEKP